MRKIAADELWKLEDYARERAAFRTRALAHKRMRTVQAGAHATFAFEDRLTVQYHVQEMLRIERIFEPEAVAEELAAYNPLIPDGANLKATFLIEYPDPNVRRRQLELLRGIEHMVALEVDGFAPIRAIADEDLERSNETKTSAVHFLRFEFASDTIASLHAGAGLSLAIGHPAYHERMAVLDPARAALLRDFD